MAADLVGIGNNARLGPETRITCYKAVELFRKINSYAARIIITAGYSDKHCTLMSERMEGFIRPLVAKGSTITRQARQFVTYGEVCELVDYLRANQGVIEVYVVVKWWHALRTYCLLVYAFSKAGLGAKIKMRPCRSASILQIPLAFWDLLGIPHNFWRIRREQRWRRSLRSLPVE